MPKYDGSTYFPPAPVATVRVVNPQNGKLVDGVILLLDSGADVTLLPRHVINPLAHNRSPLSNVELFGFDGTRTVAPVLDVEVQLLNKSFGGEFPPSR